MFLVFEWEIVRRTRDHQAKCATEDLREKVRTRNHGDLFSSLPFVILLPKRPWLMMWVYAKKTWSKMVTFELVRKIDPLDEFPSTSSMRHNKIDYSPEFHEENMMNSESWSLNEWSNRWCFIPPIWACPPIRARTGILPHWNVLLGAA